MYFKDILPTTLLRLLARDKAWRNKWIWFRCIKQASPQDQQPATQFNAKVMHIKTFVLQCLTVTISLITKSVVEWRWCNWNCPIFKRTNLGTWHCNLKKKCHRLFGVSFSDQPGISWNYIPRPMNIHKEVVHSYSRYANQYQSAEKSLTTSNWKVRSSSALLHHLLSTSDP